MAEKSRGTLQGSRKKLKKEGKTTITDRMKEFEEGETARIDIDPVVQKGRPHHRFHGRTVEVTGKRGEAYRTVLKDGNDEKTFFILPVHLEEVE